MVFLAAGMIVLWLVIFGLVLSVMRRQTRLDEQLDVLRSSLPETRQ